MTGLSAIYNTKLLELAANIPLNQRLESPDATATAHSKLCGSVITVDLVMNGDVVSDFGQTVKACLLGQSAASVVGHNIIGTTVTELQAVGATMLAMLKEGGAPPSGRWGDLALLEAVRDYPARHTSTMLIFTALEKAFAEIDAVRLNGEMRSSSQALS